MKSSIRSATIARSFGLTLIAGYLAGFTAAAMAQTPAAPAITKLTTVEVQQTGSPPTGPFPIVIEHDPRVILAADRVIELGPGAGARGGRITFDGSVKAALAAGGATARAVTARPRKVKPVGRKPATAVRDIERLQRRLRRLFE